MTDESTDRRRFLKRLGGAALAAGLAGCSGDGGGETTTTEASTETFTDIQTDQEVQLPGGGGDDETTTTENETTTTASGY